MAKQDLEQEWALTLSVEGESSLPVSIGTDLKISGSKDQVMGQYSLIQREIMAYNEDVSRFNITVKDYCLQYLEQRRYSSVDPRTVQRDELEIRRIIHYFGDEKLRALRADQIRNIHTSIRANKEMSENMLHHMHQKMNQIYEQARLDDVVEKNPCAGIKVPRPAAKEKVPLCEAEVIELFRVLTNQKPSANTMGVLLGLATGMRVGEVLGLRWKNVHFDLNKIYVAESRSRVSGQKKPKTKTSIRWISLDETTSDFLKIWKLEQARQFKEDNLPVYQTPDTNVITNTLGKPYDPNTYSRWFRNFCVENGFGEFKEIEVKYDKKNQKRVTKKKYEGLTFHILRHTQATLLAQKNVDLKTIQNRLGHSQATLTLDIYTHAVPQKDEIAASQIGSMFTAPLLEEPKTEVLSIETPDAFPEPEIRISDIDKIKKLFKGRKKKELTLKEIQEATEIKSMKRCKTLIRKLVEEGFLIKLGRTKDVRYIRA